MSHGPSLERPKYKMRRKSVDGEGPRPFVGAFFEGGQRAAVNFFRLEDLILQLLTTKVIVEECRFEK